MYAGITIGRRSGRIVGVHQKIDRAARRNLNNLVRSAHDFPGIRNILHFEGRNGPDGLKIKKSSKDIPWHFINPLDKNDTNLLTIINDHIFNLSLALEKQDEIRAAFEAAWLAHAITDGLTPAHLKFIDEKIEELFGSSPRDMGYAGKKIIKGDNRLDVVAKNWEYWGAGGVIVNHLKYEIGVATVIASEKFLATKTTSSDLDYLNLKGFEATFMKSLRKIFAVKSYENFSQNGMTMELAFEIKKTIIPEIINCVTLAWYQAYLMSKK